MTDSLLQLFERCLGAKYIHAKEDGDYAVEVKGHTLYLLFECSNGGRDWKNNLDFPAAPYRHMGERWYCHRGFLRVWRNIKDDVESEVAAAILRHPSVRELICVGYSHGAALAVLATEDMVYRFGERHVAGYGFGCPRVVWGILPKTVAKRFRHFTVVRNIPDLVTHVPPVLFGFRHVGSVLRIGKGNGYTPVGAHYPTAYTRSLEEIPNLRLDNGTATGGFPRNADQYKTK